MFVIVIILFVFDNQTSCVLWGMFQEEKTKWKYPCSWKPVLNRVCTESLGTPVSGLSKPRHQGWTEVTYLFTSLYECTISAIFLFTLSPGSASSLSKMAKAFFSLITPTNLYSKYLWLLCQKPASVINEINIII